MPVHRGGLNKDTLSGLLFVGFGVGFLWLAQEHGMGSGSRMGPGLFPTLLSAVLTLIGVATALRGLFAGAGPVRDIAWRGLALVLLATLLFAVLLRSAGLLPATVALVLVGAFASREARWPEVVALAAGLAGFCVLVFVYGLGLPVRAIGPLLGG